jgi:hypothetical protein
MASGLSLISLCIWKSNYIYMFSKVACDVLLAKGGPRPLRAVFISRADGSLVPKYYKGQRSGGNGQQKVEINCQSIQTYNCKLLIHI